MLIGLAVVLSAIGPIAAQSSIAPSAQKSNGVYRLGPSDVLRITVLKQDLLTQDGVRIGNDGNIRLLMLEDPIQAGCLTEAELSAVITERYRKYILNPQVYVSVREFNSSTVAVIGAVNSPGRFQLQRPVRLLEMLALVNGPAAGAHTELQILRTSAARPCDEGSSDQAPQNPGSESEPEILSLDINEILSGSTSVNPYLRGGDIIRVTQAEQKQAYILGNVRSAFTVNLKDPVTLTTAIAMAGGTLSGSQLEKIKITRQTPGSLAKSDVFVNLKEIRDGVRPDVLLQPNDIVDVPGPSGTKKLFKDIIRTIVPVFTRMPVVIP